MDGRVRDGSGILDTAKVARYSAQPDGAAARLNFTTDFNAPARPNIAQRVVNLRHASAKAFLAQL